MNDIYSVKGRLLNKIANEDIAISRAGNVMVNMYVHVLMSFYDYAEKNNLPELASLAEKAENFPKDVIKLINPAPPKSLYDQLMESQPLYPDTQSALKAYQTRYEELGGDDFWMKAECSDTINPDYTMIMNLSRRIQMCKYLIEKENA